MTTALANIPFVAAKHYTPDRWERIDLIVIHSAECDDRPGAAMAVGHFFAGPNAPQASAHYVVDSAAIVQCVRDADEAWHAERVNPYSIGIEHTGWARWGAGEWPDALLENSANLTGTLCLRYGIPIQRVSPIELRAGVRGICGHVDVQEAFYGGRGHWDPGPGWPWEKYIELVRAGAVPT